MNSIHLLIIYFIFINILNSILTLHNIENSKNNEAIYNDLELVDEENVTKFER